MHKAAAVALKNIEDIRAEPARLAEFDRPATVARSGAEKTVQPRGFKVFDHPTKRA